MDSANQPRHVTYPAPMNVVQSFTLDTGADDRFDESWANVKDPKEKKKMQNRIAQKSYRQRMKARLQDLQAKVQYHERLGQMNNGSLEKVIDMTTSHRNGAMVAPHNMVDTPQTQAAQIISPRLLQSSYFDHGIDEDDVPLYLQHSQLIESTESQQQKQQEKQHREQQHQQHQHQQHQQHQHQQHQQHQQHPQHPQHQQHGPKSPSLTPDLADHSSKSADKAQPVLTNLWNKRKRMTFDQSDIESNDTERISSEQAGRYQLYTPGINDVADFDGNRRDAWATNLLSQTQARQPTSFAVDLLDSESVPPVSPMAPAQHQNQRPQLQQRPTPPQQQQRQQQQQPTPPLAQPTPPQHYHQPKGFGQPGLLPPTSCSVKSQASCGDMSSGSAGGHSDGGSSSSRGSIMTDKPMTYMLPGTPGGPLRDHKLEERFEYVLYCLRTAGFDSFDELATAYYSSSFDESSTLAMEQRLSRNRGLPNVMAELFRSAGFWSDWERRGFHEELLKTTEMMLISESKKVPVGSLSMALQNGEAAAQSIPAMKTAIQNELPNLWALLMALAVDERDVWQRNRSNPALAAILVLRCSGRIPDEQLLGLIGTCLEAGR